MISSVTGLRMLWGKTIQDIFKFSSTDIDANLSSWIAISNYIINKCLFCFIHLMYIQCISPLYHLFKGLGYCMVTVSWLIGLYYNVVIAHTLFYLVSSFTSKLPWEDCRNDWNTDNCVDKYMNSELILIYCAITTLGTSCCSTLQRWYLRHEKKIDN